MTAVSRLIYQAATGQTVPAGPDRCHICGLPTDGGIPVAEVIKEGFTALDVLRDPSSPIVCPACAWTKAQRESRTKHYVVTEHEWRFLTRDEIGQAVLHPPEPPFALVVQESYKKHTWLQAQVNYSTDRFYVSLEETPILVDRIEFARLLEAAQQLYNLGFGKEEIRTGHYFLPRLEKVGLETWAPLEEQVKPHRGSMHLELAITCLVKPAKKEDPKHGNSAEPVFGQQRTRVQQATFF